MYGRVSPFMWQIGSSFSDKLMDWLSTTGLTGIVSAVAIALSRFSSVIFENASNTSAAVFDSSIFVPDDSPESLFGSVTCAWIEPSLIFVSGCTGNCRVAPRQAQQHCVRTPLNMVCGPVVFFGDGSL